MICMIIYLLLIIISIHITLIISINDKSDILIYYNKKYNVSGYLVIDDNKQK